MASEAWILTALGQQGTGSEDMGFPNGRTVGEKRWVSAAEGLVAGGTFRTAGVWRGRAKDLSG